MALGVDSLDLIGVDSLDLTLVHNFDDGFYLDSKLEDHIVRLQHGASSAKTADLVFLALEARGEILPYFMNPPKTIEGGSHQYHVLHFLPKLFLHPETQETVDGCVEWLQQNPRSRERVYRDFDALVRPYSHCTYVDLTALPLLSSDRKDLRIVQDLSRIMGKAAHHAMPCHDAVALAIIYLTTKGYDLLRHDFVVPQDSLSRDPHYFFAAFPGEGGRRKRAAQQRSIGLGDGLHQRVFRALLDYGNYFEDRFDKLTEILPHVDVRA